MATISQNQEQESSSDKNQESSSDKKQESDKKLLSSYLRLSFSLFLISLPRNSLSVLWKNQNLNFKLYQAEEQLKMMKSRRKEDSKANARVVEIFASHRNSWQLEEKRLIHQIESREEEFVRLRAKVDELEHIVCELKKDVSERDEMISFMSRKTEFGADYDDYDGDGGGEEFCVDDSRFGKVRVSEEEEDQCFVEGDFTKISGEIGDQYGRYNDEGFNSDDLLASASKFWSERANIWQDVQYESPESLYHMKHPIGRRESPWKADGESAEVSSAGISSKLKSLEQELLNFERIGKSDISKIPALTRKQAKRYQALAGKIDDLCRRMQSSDPCEPTVSLEFRTQRQTEFLLEAFRLQQRASETGQKLTTIQTETGKNYMVDEYGGGLVKRRSLDCIRNNFKEIQRNLEIWLARIIGDLEGILARDGASRVREYYISRYPFVQ